MVVSEYHLVCDLSEGSTSIEINDHDITKGFWSLCVNSVTLEATTEFNNYLSIVCKNIRRQVRLTEGLRKGEISMQSPPVTVFVTERRNKYTNLVPQGLKEYFQLNRVLDQFLNFEIHDMITNQNVSNLGIVGKIYFTVCLKK
jgi:hypothetical protein